MKPMIFVLVATNLLHVFLCWLYIYPMGMGFLGAPTATATAQYFMLLAGIALIWYKKYHHRTWPSVSMEIFRGWGGILRFGVPGALMLCLEWWSFELCALAAGWLGAIQLDSFVSLLQIQSFIFMVPLGISVAISTITGNRLGSADPQLAKEGATVAMIVGLCTQSLIAFLLFLLRAQVGLVFSNDSAVIAIVSEVFPITAVMLVFDAMQAVGGGILRGIGYQSIGAATNLAGYYLFGLPIAAVLVWQSWEVKGLELGLMVAVFITAAVFVFTILRVDWVKESREAVRRVTEERMSLDNKPLIAEGSALPRSDKPVAVSDAPKRSASDEPDKEKADADSARSNEPRNEGQYTAVAIRDEEKKEPAEARPVQHVV